jgi:hypothetical protein
MLDAEIFSWYINTMHINGVSTLASRVVYKYLGTDYSDFYEDFFRFLQTDPWWVQEQAEVRQYFANWMRDGKLNHPNIGGIEIHGWNLIHRTILNLHVERKYDHIFDLLDQFLASYNLPEDLHRATMQFQRRYLVRYDQISTYPENLDLDYNLWEYLTFDQPLQLQSTSYRLDFPEDKNMSFARFLELFYFARRRNFGKTTVESLNDETLSSHMVRRGTTDTRSLQTNHA